MQRKPDFGVFYKARLKPVSIATESLGMILSNESKTNALIRQGFPSGDGWGHPLCHFFCLQTVQAQVWPDRSKLSETLTVFLIFFH